MSEFAGGQSPVEAIPQTALRLDTRTPESWGNEKQVYRVTYNNQILAAKIYREVSDNGDQQDRKELATRELEMAQRFKDSPLGPHIPTPYGLILGEDNEPVGLATEWVDGILLSRDPHLQLLRNEELDSLHEKVIATANTGLIPSIDMVNDSNIIFATGRQQRLWFAECETSEQPVDYALGFIRNTMDKMREQHTSKRT